MSTSIPIGYESMEMYCGGRFFGDDSNSLDACEYNTWSLLVYSSWKKRGDAYLRDLRDRHGSAGVVWDRARDGPEGSDVRRYETR